VTRRYFGTDGIRGRVNEPPMTPEMALRVGLAAGRSFRRGDHRHRVLIGKDTRLSGYMLEPALTAGFTASGMDVILVGPMPTPAVAMLTRAMRCDLGVMISASHNPYADNGIKLFGPDGFKLSDAKEREIEALIDAPLDQGLAVSSDLGRAKRLDDVEGRYVEFVKATLPAGFALEGLKVVVDCAHGAAYKVAPTVLWELGAEVFPLAVAPDGFNINADCGSTHPDAMAATVRELGADVGIAFDGDADRVVFADERGAIVDGDQLLALLAESLVEGGRLKGGCVVATVMSNLGLERHLAGLGLRLERTQVGDRYVLERMRKIGANLGGEQSGHIILLDHTTTGDGLLTAVHVLRRLKEVGEPASAVLRRFAPVPQILRNHRFDRTKGDPLAAPAFRKAVQAAERRLGAGGRLVVRKSGTEPVIRLMAEGDDPALVAAVLDELEAVLVQAAAA